MKSGGVSRRITNSAKIRSHRQLQAFPRWLDEFGETEINYVGKYCQELAIIRTKRILLVIVLLFGRLCPKVPGHDDMTLFSSFLSEGRVSNAADDLDYGTTFQGIEKKDWLVRP